MQPTKDQGPGTKDKMRWQVFQVPKHGSKADEYEDAFAANPDGGRFAVADGASESSFAALWAQLLVDGFARPARKPEVDPRWIEPLQKRWATEVDGKPLPWYAEDKRDQGAFATFLGFVVKKGTFTDKGAGGVWSALAIGDSCLVQVRHDSILTAFPLGQAADFSNQPALLGSRSDPAQAPQERADGQWQAGDQFFLMTDAMAQWFLKACEKGLKPWRAIHKLLGNEKPDSLFARFIEELRHSEGMRNDDVTLIPIEL